MLRIDKRELPEYQYEDAVVRDAYNAAARELEQQALVRLEWARKQSVLSCIVLDLERVAQCYECADRVHPQKGRKRSNVLLRKSWRAILFHGSQHGGMLYALRHGTA